MNGAIIPPKEEIESVSYTQGTNVTTLVGTIFRKGNLVYFSLYANATVTNVQPILTIDDAKNRPKAQLNFGGAYDGGSYHGGGTFYLTTGGQLRQNMSGDTGAKLMSVSGVYEAAE